MKVPKRAMLYGCSCVNAAAGGRRRTQRAAIPIWRTGILLHSEILEALLEKLVAVVDDIRGFLQLVRPVGQEPGSLIGHQLTTQSILLALIELGIKRRPAHEPRQIDAPLTFDRFRNF